MDSLSSSLRRNFLTGLAFLIPLVATGWILILVYKAIESLTSPIVRILLPKEWEPPEMVQNIAGFVGIILLIMGLGFMARNVLGERILKAIDQVFLRIPVIAFIYNGLKQMIDAFRHFGGSRNFKRVVYVEYPSPGSRLIGFVTSHYFDVKRRQGITCVFVPTSPNPMTGFVIVVEDDKVMESHLSLEEASKIIFSAGLVSPEELQPAFEDTEAPPPPPPPPPHETPPSAPPA